MVVLAGFDNTDVNFSILHLKISITTKGQTETFDPRKAISNVYTSPTSLLLILLYHCNYFLLTPFVSIFNV